ncbi:aldehyde dehydrogenase family protein, partial [Tamlana crocina]
MSSIAEKFGINQALKDLGLNVDQVNNGTSTGQEWFSNGEVIDSYSPVDGALIGKVKSTTKEDYNQVIETAAEAFKTWRSMPSPQRGEIVRKFNDELRRL